MLIRLWRLKRDTHLSSFSPDCCRRPRFGTVSDDPALWHVLVVDDNFENRDTLSLILDFYEARVTEAESGQEALQLLDEQPDLNLCLLDIVVPELTGWEVLERIRNHPRQSIRTMPVIAVTVLWTPGEHRAILDAGFDGHLVKPYSVSTLIQDISQILATYRSTRTAQSKR